MITWWEDFLKFLGSAWVQKLRVSVSGRMDHNTKYCAWKYGKKCKLSGPGHVCPNACLSRTTCSLSRYNVEGELDCFDCKTGFFFSDYSLQWFTKESKFHVFAKKLTRLWEIFNNYKEKLIVPKAHTVA